ncbi:MAG: sulfotransferase domain-containing protein [Pseudomonadota bacterium]
MQRPTSIEQMQAQTAAFVTEEGYAKGVAYRPDPTDIFISPYAKCGTTWMQQIVHGLRTGGDMDFGEISEVVPWLELAHDLRQDIHAPQKARPQAFKSHLNWHEIPKGGRYIVVLRDPVDAMVSLFRFLEGWHFETGSISVDAFGDYFLNRDQAHDYWVHAASWWGQRKNPNVLLLAYEDMKADLPGTVARVADFMGITDEVTREIATQQASFEFMKAHGAHFEEKLTQRYRDPPCGLPPGGPASKVDTGKVGGGKPAVSAKIRARFEDQWTRTLAAEFGLRNYQALVDALRA